MKTPRLTSTVVVPLLLAGFTACAGEDPANNTPVNMFGGAGTDGLGAAGLGAAGTTSGAAGSTGNLAGATNGVAGATNGVAGATNGVAGATNGVAGAMNGVAGATNGVAGAMNGVAGAMNGVAGADNAMAGMLGAEAGADNGAAGSTAVAGTGDCTFDITPSMSSAISTVGIVEWSTSLAVTDATIEFTLTDTGATLVAPVDLSKPNYRTLLLGMKGDGYDYTAHIVAKDASGETCVSEDFNLTTGYVDNNVPAITVGGSNPGAGETGFIVTSGGLSGGNSPVYIFDTDGDIVWWGPSAQGASRAMMDWEGEWMYSMSLNFPAMTGQMRRVSMDGEKNEQIANFTKGHHDFTVAPGGIVTAIVWGGSGNCSQIVELSPDGTQKTIVQSVDTLYAPSNNECHTNSIVYHESTDSYTIGDRYPNMYVSFDRSGTLQWQLGGSNPKGKHFSTTAWQVNHGHHLTSDGKFLLFNNTQSGGMSPVIEFTMTDTTATETWRYQSSAGSLVLGDVQRLPNGNTLVTYSVGGQMHEVDPGGNAIRTFSARGDFGYSNFYKSLYEPPLKNL